MQAVLTVLAVGAAIWVPWRQRRHQILDAQRAEENMRSAMAQALISPVNELTAGARVMLEILQMERFEARHANLISLPADSFKMAEEFRQFRTSLYLLGETGRSINYMLTCADGLRVFHQEHVRAPHDITAADSEKAQFESEQIQEVGLECLDHLKKMTGFMTRDVHADT